LSRIKLIGFDSMGTRGMATVIEASDLKIVVDPGVSYAPRRYGLPPHPIELEALEKHLEEVRRETADADIVVISHYHRDHYLYRSGEEEYYRGKVLFVKDPVNNINYSQRVRAYVLFNKMNVKNIAREVRVADNNTYSFSGVIIKFSKPLPHGPRNTKLGYVIAALVDTGDQRVVHASDVQGPIEDSTVNSILELKPTILIISGPPTYFEGYKMSRELVERGLRNLARIVEGMARNTTVIVDHHLLRDLNYREYLRSVQSIGEERGVRVTTAAEYMGVEVRQLEALRRELWMRESR